MPQTASSEVKEVDVPDIDGNTVDILARLNLKSACQSQACKGISLCNGLCSYLRAGVLATDGLRACGRQDRQGAGQDAVQSNKGSVVATVCSAVGASSRRRVVGNRGGVDIQASHNGSGNDGEDKLHFDDVVGFTPQISRV
jgi:hypothetical protein